MSRRKLTSSFIGLALGFVCVAAQFFVSESRVRQQSQSKAVNAAPAKLTEAETKLVENSRKAIIRSGLSGQYFDRQFRLVKVVNQPGDRRVVWKFSVGEYETIVNDVLGYYTKDGKRFDTHGVTATLQATSEIKRTISRRSANQIMQRCIGRFINPHVEYRSSGSEVARLAMTAESVPKISKLNAKEREREEREARERAAKSQGSNATDEIESERKKGPPIITGTVDLQSGKCMKGQLLVGPGS